MKRKRVRGSNKKKEYLIDCLQLPKDALLDSELVYLTGNSEMIIRHFRKLMAYSGREICVRAGIHRIRIKGSGLIISYCAAEELKIRGCIDSISYEEG